MQDILADPDLLHKLFAGIGVVRIYDDRRMRQFMPRFPCLLIMFQKILQILIMIIRNVSAKLVHISAQNGMCIRIAGRLDLPSAV